MPLRVSYRLRETVEIHQEREGVWLFCPHGGGLASWNARQPLALAQALGQRWMDEAEMAAHFAPGQADPPGPSFHLFFLRLITAGLVDLRVQEDDKVLFSVSPAPDEEALRRREPLGPTPPRLSRFAYLRAQDSGLLLESPLTRHRLRLDHAPLLALVNRLVVGDASEPRGEGEAALLALLLNLGLAGPEAATETEDPLEYWEFHDLLFHARSLSGHHCQPIGGTYRFQGRRPAPPAVRQPTAEASVNLPRPSAGMATRLDAPLARVLANRRSQRVFDPRPMLLDELVAFLHASARVQRIVHDHRHGDEVSFRPHPSAGARHPLEIYPLVRSCQGLDPGAYRYDPLGHALERVAGEPSLLAGLLADNPYHLESPNPPQVCLFLAARVDRTSWKYESIAYRIINQDLGCLYQTFYLVATALGLAPCAIGNLDAPRAGRALGLDWRREPLVGRFTLGCPIPSGEGPEGETR